MNDGTPATFSNGNAADADAPTAEQTALLRHFDLLPAAGISATGAGALIAQLEAAPDWQEHLEAWHRDKAQLHPELFAPPPPPIAVAPPTPTVAAPPPRSFRDARWWQSQIADGNLFGYSFRQPTVKQALVILESLDVQTPGWDRESKKRRTHRFMNELATLSPELCKPGCSFPHELPPDGDEAEETPAFDPTVRGLSAPSLPFAPSPYAATAAPPIGLSRPAWQPPEQPPVQPAAEATPAGRNGAWKWVIGLLILAAGAGAYAYFGFRAAPPVRDERAAAASIIVDRPGGPTRQSASVLPTLAAKDSQRRAMEKYPDLGKSGSPLNQTFVALVHQLEVERSPRLQQPDWPERLADECAAALVIAPAVRSHATPPTRSDSGR